MLNAARMFMRPKMWYLKDRNLSVLAFPDIEEGVSTHMGRNCSTRSVLRSTCGQTVRPAMVRTAVMFPCVLQ